MYKWKNVLKSFGWMDLPKESRTKSKEVLDDTDLFSHAFRMEKIEFHIFYYHGLFNQPASSLKTLGFKGWSKTPIFWFKPCFLGVKLGEAPRVWCHLSIFSSNSHKSCGNLINPETNSCSQMPYANSSQLACEGKLKHRSDGLTQL